MPNGIVIEEEEEEEEEGRGFTLIHKRNKITIVNLLKSLCPRRPFVSFRLVVQDLGDRLVFW